MKRALARHDANEARVIPIILRPSDWKSTPFAKLKALPTDGKPVVQWRTHDEAFVDVVKGIKRAIKDLHDSASRMTQDNGGVHNIYEQLDQQRAAPIEPALPPSAHPARTINTIGSVGGRRNTVIQGENITTYHYGGKASSDRSAKNRADPQTVALANLQAIVNELNDILDNQLMYPQEERYSRIDPERIALFTKLINIMVSQSISIPGHLLEDVRRLCQRLQISPLV